MRVVAASALEQELNLPLPLLGFKLKEPEFDQAGVGVAVGWLQLGSALIGGLRVGNVTGFCGCVAKHDPGRVVVRAALDSPRCRSACTFQVVQAEAAPCELDLVPARAVAQSVRLPVGGSCLAITPQ